MSYKDTNRLLGGVLLVAGTTIGAGMLALPIVSGLAGFIPTIILMAFFWLFMSFTALLMLEVNLWMPEHTNLITMARKTLGKGGALVSWVIYLFLLYTLTIAYIAGSAPIFIEFVQLFSGWKIPIWAGSFPLLVIFGFFVYLGTRSVDYINRLLMIGLTIIYFVMIALLTPHVDSNLLKNAHWGYLWVPVSVISTSFGFHIIIPTLTDYLRRDVVQLRKVIIIGSLIPLIVYAIWVGLTMGIVPVYGENSLYAGFQNGLDGATVLSDHLGHTYLGLLTRVFSLFAIVTSFLGVSLSLFDFLSDGLKIPKTTKGRALLYGLTFVPPLVFTLIDPYAFLHALEYAGAFGVITLLAIMPILMVWKGRYIQKRESKFKAPGNKAVLVLGLAVSILVIGLEVANKTGLLPKISSNIEQVNHS